MENEKDNSAMRADDPEFLLSQYLDGQLEPAQMERLEERLGNDISLRREMQLYGKLDEMLAELRRPKELESVNFDAQRQEIMAALERKALLKVRPKFNVIRLTFMGVGALAAAVVIAVGTWVALRTPPPSQIVSTPIIRVYPAMPDASRGQVAVTIAEPAVEIPDQDQVAVQCQRLPDKEVAKWQAREVHENGPDGTVLMIGVSPKPAEPPPSSLVDLMME
jgi:hypothetical protein